MPLYEFACPDCGAVFEEICAATAGAPACPQCGGARAQRAISMPSPLKKGAFPFRPGPVHPLAQKMAAGPACSPCAARGNSCSG